MADTATRAPDATGRRGSNILGLLLLLSGAAWFLRASGLWQVSVETLLAGLLVLVGLVTVTTARAGHQATWPVIAGAALVVALVATSAGPRVDWNRLTPTGDQASAPTSVDELPPAYRVTGGNLSLDLSGITAVPAGGPIRQLDVKIVGGNATIVLPPDTVPVSVEARSAFGNVTMPDGSDTGGLASHRVYRTSSQRPPLLRIVVRVTFGHATVDFAGSQPTGAAPAPGP